MEEKILSFFNKIFNCLKNEKLKKFEDLCNPKITYEIGLEIDNKLFSQIDTSITGEDELSIRISELNEVSEVYLNLLKPPEFNPTEKFKEEIELIDIIGIANKEEEKIINFSILIIICVLFCEKNDYYISKINNLEKDEKDYIYNIVLKYSNLPEKCINEKKLNNSSIINDNSNKDYIMKIEHLENELKIEKENNSKLKIMEDEYNNIKNKFLNIETKYSSLLKEITDVKNKNKELKKIIKDKDKKIGILENKLNEKNKTIKERDILLDKEKKMSIELNSKIDELNNIKSINDIDYESKYKEELKINDDLKNENLELNELINIMENKLNEKNNEEIENDMNNIRITEEFEKKMKNCEKEKDEIKNQFDKEFQLMASAIYNLGFQFWSLKLEDSHKLKQNENWLVRERIKQYNGDY